MRIILVLLLAMCANATDFEWVKLYREGGTQAIEAKIDKVLQTKAFWQESLKEKDVRFGYYENLQYLFVATKNLPTLKLYELENNKWEEKLNTNALVGSRLGHKQKEGDLATPIGVYNLNARLSNLDQYYGPLAFSTSYPNLFDKLHKRTGYGIWIHGMPLNGNREEKNTQGCIAIENNLLTMVDKTIDHKKSLLITFENKVKEVTLEDLAQLLANLYEWKEAWKQNDVEKYLGFYSKAEFIRFDGARFDEFSKTKHRIFAKEEQKSIIFSKINIAPYPNDENRNLFRISFFEDYKAPTYSFSGEKELYVELKNNKMQILAEK
ncbi:L,D-transpeptidase family protein [Helicobacter burdigaliensis]|uniref:L,D-transpeptidase family protein n=1 Tax=Helicobacter burdigaliensis TaxID=2315334 RepID=UPI000EF668A6|nr:L,D-transpeptidase family protein [Helicobacter burdigaliensis]